MASNMEYKYKFKCKYALYDPKKIKCFWFCDECGNYCICGNCIYFEDCLFSLNDVNNDCPFGTDNCCN